MRSRRSWGQRILLSSLVVVALLASGAAGVAAYFAHKLDRLSYVDVELSVAPPTGAPRNLLIVGSDNREGLVDRGIDGGAFLGAGAGGGQRSDTIIVVRVDPPTGEVDVLSIPRDLWVPIPGTGGSQRINTAYAAGPQQLIDTIESNFDIPIHHYVEIDFVGFVDLVDAVGGVPMWFDTPVRDAQSGLNVPVSGCHRLDAESALAFTRSRAYQYQDDNGRWHTDPTGDLGRISRQQVFLRRAADQVGELGVGDALTLNRLLDVGIDSVTLDRGLGLDRIRELAGQFADYDSDTMRTHAVPTYSFRTSGGALVEGLEEAEAQPALNIFRGLPADALAPVQVQDVTVLNGTGEEGVAAQVAGALDEIGFGVTGTGNTDDEFVARTRIRYGTGGAHAADLLERHLTAGAELEADAGLEPGAVVLEVGADLTTIGRNAHPYDPDAVPTEAGSPVGDSTGPGTTSDDDGTDGDDGPGTPETPGVAPPTSDPIGVAPDPSMRCV